ncbi:TPA: hypothetical protein ACXDFY_000719 [Enterobacter roggenkampii]|uniref:hypothetical protein n=1 Tax=Enterobacter cloacae complex TaxID=354276 RepID=UPI000795D8AE|nr:hypothetical protein [Enterobacter hormaechei]SAI06321.1 Uncharacterised protein [Enterobacter hormaechei]HDF7628635.1 hypothetical protein [Enterobacter hormaechei]HDR2757172.1 hypothetical protein [Enterobacter mori]HDR2776650.1 hypothetical protein [Enterobacter mori]
MKIFIGEDLKLTNNEGANITIGSKNSKIFENDNASENLVIPTGDFVEGQYSIVIFENGKFVSSELLNVVSPFAARTKKQQLIDIINSLDEVIEYRMTGNDDAIQSMSINGKTFTYETLDSLLSARKKFLSQLNAIVQAEKEKKGISPIKTIKYSFRGA